MDATIEISSLIAIATGISAVVGAWLHIRKLQKEFKKEREAEKAAILQEAKEADAKMKAQWEARREVLYQEITNKIEALDSRVDTLEKSVEKDLEHIREKQEGEIRVLGDKIEDLRTELRTQHGQLITMLTKMIEASRD